MSHSFASQVNQAADDARNGRLPDPSLAARWMEPRDSSELSALMAAAGSLRATAEGDTVEFCAIVNARSGRCSGKLLLLRPERPLPRQGRGLPPAQRRGDGAPGPRRRRRRGPALRHRDQRPGAAQKARPLDEICEAIEVLTNQGIIAPCASLGLLEPAQARRLRAAGLVRYHHNLEAGPTHFARICTTHAYEGPGGHGARRPRTRAWRSAWEASWAWARARPSGWSWPRPWPS